MLIQARVRTRTARSIHRPMGPIVQIFAHTASTATALGDEAQCKEAEALLDYLGDIPPSPACRNGELCAINNIQVADTSSSGRQGSHNDYAPSYRIGDMPSRAIVYETPMPATTAKERVHLGKRRLVAIDERVPLPSLKRRHTAPSTTSTTGAIANDSPGRQRSFTTPPSTVPDSHPSDSTLASVEHAIGPSVVQYGQQSPCAERRPAKSCRPSQPSIATQNDPIGSSGCNWSPLKRKEATKPMSQSSPPTLPASSNPSSMRTTHVSSSQARQGNMSTWVSIRPSPPPTARYGALASHMTPALGHFGRHTSLRRLFRPRHAARVVRRLERGYWRLPRRRMMDWPDSIRDKFWHFVQRFIGDGRAGWGTWLEVSGLSPLSSQEYEADDLHSEAHIAADGLHEACHGLARTTQEGAETSTHSHAIRAACTSTSPVDTIRESAAATGNTDMSKRPEWLRLWCWGEVVRETWLMLIVASSRRVMGLEARWIDAEGQAVLIME